MASHQFLLSREVCVMTPVTTSDKSDEALVKVVRLCWSLKPIDINLCRGRWLETLSEWQTDERMSEKERHKNHLVDVDMTNNRWWRANDPICLRRLGEETFIGLLE